MVGPNAGACGRTTRPVSSELQAVRRLAWIGLLFAVGAPFTLVLISHQRFIGVGPFLFPIVATIAGFRSERRGSLLGALPFAVGLLELMAATGLQFIMATSFPP